MSTLKSAPVFPPPHHLAHQAGDRDALAAITEAQLVLNFATHANANDPTSGQKAALAGTVGTPGALNPFVTDADPRLGGAITVAASFVHDFLFG